MQTGHERAAEMEPYGKRKFQQIHGVIWSYSNMAIVQQSLLSNLSHISWYADGKKIDHRPYLNRAIGKNPGNIYVHVAHWIW